MYKYLGFGLLTLVAILMIPAQDIESITNPSMYGMAILSVHDSAGNTLLTNIVHNEVVDEGTTQMLGCAFEDNLTTVCASDTTQANAICLTDAAGFDPVANDATLNSVNFLTTGGGGTNSFDDDNGTDDSCIVVAFTLTATAITGALTNFAAGGVNIADGETITGFALCDIDADLDGCTAANPLISAIATSVTLNAGETVDITYVLNLD